MEISSKSWHYRLWRFGRENPYTRPRDLCRYFWHIALIKILLPVALLVFAIGGLIGLIVVIWKNPLSTAIAIGLIAAFAGFITALAYIGKRSDEKKKRRQAGLEPVPEPGVVRSYLAARKSKICPLIEVTNEREFR